MKKISFWGTLFLLATLAFPAAAQNIPAPMQEDSYVGIGARFLPWTKDNIVSSVYINQLVCNGPADKEELKYGDVVVAIDGTSLAGLTLREFYKIAMSIPRNAEDDPVTLTSVTLTIKRKHEGADDEQFDVKIDRQKVIRNYDC